MLESAIWQAYRDHQPVRRSNMKVALLGTNGQLGQDLQRALEAHDVTPLTRIDVDVTNSARTRTVLMGLHPEVVFNTTAYHRVDDCESNLETAYVVNTLSVLYLVRIAIQIDATVAHLSTDYVFDGDTWET